MVLEGPWSVNVACQDAARVEVLSDKLFELVDNGHFNTGKRECGRGCRAGEWFWDFTCSVKGGFYKRFGCLGVFLEFFILGTWVSCYLLRMMCFEKEFLLGQVVL